MNNHIQQKLENYIVPKKARDLIRNTRVVFMVGISAAGKDTVRTKLLLSGKYHHIISHTTRPPRANHGVMEINGTDYHFVDFSKVERMLDNNEFVEAKIFSGNIYGTSIEEIKKAHDESKIAITDIEVQGVAEYRKISEKLIPIFLLPPNYEIWQKRLQGRYLDGEINLDDIKKRMNTAKIELQEALEKPYFEYVVNEDLNKTLKIVDEIAHEEFSSKKNALARDVARDILDKLDSQ